VPATDDVQAQPPVSGGPGPIDDRLDQRAAGATAPVFWRDPHGDQGGRAVRVHVRSGAADPLTAIPSPLDRSIAMNIVRSPDGAAKARARSRQVASGRRTFFS